MPVRRRGPRAGVDGAGVGRATPYLWFVADPAELDLDELDVSEDERAELSRLWQSEVERRLAEIDAGTARVIPASEVVGEASGNR